MAKSSIRPESEAVVPAASAAIVPAGSNALAVPEHYNPDQYDDVSRDIEVPVVGLINKVGPLSKKFPKNVGEYAFGDLFVLGETVSVIPIAVMKYYVEKVRNGVELKYGTPEAATAKTFATASEAAQAGYVVDFDGTAKFRVEEASRVAFLVVAPKDDTSGEFTLPAGSLSVALAKSSYQRGSHRGVFRPLVNHAVKLAQAKRISTIGKNATQLFEEAQAFTHLWTLSVVHQENTQRQQDWYEARIAKADPLPADTLEWIVGNYGGFKI